jgi:hypothetical protein
MVLYWVMVYSGGHKQCRWCGLGFRAVPVELAFSPGALAVQRSLKRSWSFHRACLSKNAGGRTSFVETSAVGECPRRWASGAIGAVLGIEGAGLRQDLPEPCEDFGIVVFSRLCLWLWRAVGFMVVGG